MHRLLVLALLVTLGCSKEQPRPAGLAADGFDARPNVEPPNDSGSPDTAPETAPDTAMDDAGSAPDEGPTEDVITGGGGPVIDPGGGGSIGCAADTALLTTVSLAPSTPKAFVDAWDAELAKRSHGGLLLELRGLSGSSVAAKLALGSPKPSSSGGAGAFVDVPAPGVIDLVFDGKTRALAGPRQDVSTMLFDSSLLVGAFGFRGTLDAKCSSVSAVTLTLLIPVSAGSTPFGGSTIGALLGAPNDVISPADAWRIELSGSVGGAS